MHLSFLLDFFIKYELRIVALLEERRADRGSASPPFLTAFWWTITYTLAPTIRRINTTFTQLQDRSLTIVQQRRQVQALIDDVRSHLCVELIEEVELFRPADYYRAEGSPMCVLLANIELLVEDQGSRAQAHLHSLNNDEKAAMLKEIGAFAVHLIAGLQSVQAERDRMNNASEEEAPPVMPYELVDIRNAVFISSVLNPQQARLLSFLSAEEIYNIEQDHRDLIYAHQTDAGVRAAIKRMTSTTNFNNAWDSFGANRFRSLRTFCGGLATVFANNASVEADFSILKWEKDEFRTNLIDLSLEGIFQSKQWPMLCNL
jgi:hypothetical protein